MIARYSIAHRIRFEYDATVRSEVMTLHLSPLRDRVQVVRSFSVRTDPDRATVRVRRPVRESVALPGSRPPP